MGVAINFVHVHCYTTLNACWGGQCLTQSGRGWFRPHPFLHVHILNYSTPQSLMWHVQSHVCVCICYMYVTLCVFSKLMQDKHDDTPLIDACQGKHVETARALLDHGADVDQQIT